VYKTQLKNETIVDITQEERDVAARLFRGVDGDSSRRGELFGIANLLRFRDGPFMKYGDQTREEARYGDNIYNADGLLSSNRGGNEEALQRIVGDDQNEHDLLAFAENEARTESNVHEDDEEQVGVQDLVGLTENGKMRGSRLLVTL
jgi:hypothetical protein